MGRLAGTSRDAPMGMATRFNELEQRFEPILRCALFPGAHVRRKLVHRDPANGAEKIVREIWQGQAYFGPSGSCADVYVKAQDERRTWRETFCGAVGRAMEAPVPRPFLITANDEYIPFESSIRLMASGRPMFASESVGPFAEEFTSWDAVEQCLPRWEKLPEAIVFDELVSNQDRWHGNVLFSDGKLLLIDHSETLGIGALQWSTRPLYSGGNPFLNSVLKWTMERRRHLAAGIQRVCGRLDAVDFEALSMTCHPDLLSAGEMSSAVEHVKQSRELIYPSICKRLGIPVLQVVR